MKVCIYGAGAIGGYLASALDLAGADVSLIARGPHLQAIREHGLRFVSGDETRIHRLRATDRPGDLDPQDYVIVALKAHQVPAAAAAIAGLLAPAGAVVTAVNGLPWWYFHGISGEYASRRLESVDPGGLQWRLIGPDPMSKPNT